MSELDKMQDEKQEKMNDLEKLRKSMTELDDNGLNLLFREARTHNGWLDKPVSDDKLKLIFELAISGPTSTNCQPSRFIFCTTAEAKQRLIPCVGEGNVAKINSAPVTAIIGYDLSFWVHLPRMFPHKDMSANFRNNTAAAKTAAFRNSSLQGAYFILAARAVGLDTGPMSGFNNQKVDEEFFANTDIKSNFLCNVGYGNSQTLFEKLPRFNFSEICEIL